MSKTTQCIELLKILYSRSRIVSVGELADVLETNPRNIPEYVNELRDCGYDIKTVHGRYGGYLLERHSTFPALKLSDSEWEGLMAGYEYLLARNDFMEKSDYGKASRKLLGLNPLHCDTRVVLGFVAALLTVHKPHRRYLCR